MRRLALVALALAACGPPPAARRPGRAPTAAQLMAHLRERAAKIPSLRTEAKVDYLQEGGQRLKLGMTFLFRRPGHLRMDADNPLGGTVASFASDGKTFQLLDTQSNRFLTGEASACAIGRLLRVNLRPDEVGEVLAGSAPLLGEPLSVGWDGEDGGRELLTLRDARGVTETIRLSPIDWDVREAQVEQGGKVLYRVVHENFTVDGGARFPERSQIFDPGHHADARIRYKSRAVGGEADLALFHLDAPAGIPVENVGCD